jgi:catechol 2,3-dioxygenase-like lactoylglutathione lyase family enzyme
MELTLSHCFIGVLDQDAALRFYSEVLGLEVRSDVTMDSMRWLTVGPRPARSSRRPTARPSRRSSPRARCTA